MLHLAAALAATLAIAHSILGERLLLAPLARSEALPALLGSRRFAMRTLRFAWHLTTVILVGFAGLLFHLARDELNAPRTAQVIGITMIIAGLLPLLITRGRHFSWVVLFAIGGLALYWAAG
jgi:hypothetical protein